MKERIGVVLMMLGMVTTDSKWLIVPIALMIAGAWLAKGLLNE